MRNLRIILLILLIVLSVFVNVSGVYAAALQPPRANLDESEVYFTNAYLYFMSRNYWSTQNNLDRALGVNTYLVDYYLLNGLTLDRIGDGVGALASLNRYLEVRPLDPSVPRITKNLSEQNAILSAIPGTAPVPAGWKFSRTDIMTEWNTGFTRPLSIKGMGKIKSLGQTVCISDTYGDRVYVKPANNSGAIQVFGAKSGVFREVAVNRPVITFPMGDGTFMIVNADGEIFTFANLSEHAGIISPDFVGQLSSRNISDAEIISENELAIADPVERTVGFYNAATLDVMAFWFPPEFTGDLLFEPVAIEAFADWLAIADRGNSRIYILNVMSREYFVINNVPLPRDILWSPLGELFVLSEEGSIYNYIIDFGTRSYANRHNGAMYSGLENIWALFRSPEGDLMCLETGASKIYKSIMTPPREGEQAFLGIFSPTLTMQTENRESFIISATFMTPFTSYLHTSRLIAQSAWNNRTMRAYALWSRRPNFDGMLIHRPLPTGQVLPLNLRPAQVNRGNDVREALLSFWVLHKDTLTNVVVDSSISFTIDDLITLMRFCLLNGLELDVWAREIASPGLIRASAFTGGKVVYSLKNALELTAPDSRLQIQIPLPEELSSSGYPGRSMLAVYLDAGLIQSRAWMPLWPDLFTPPSR